MRAMCERSLALALLEGGSFFLGLFGFGQTLLKLVNTTCSIHEHLLTGVERMRRTADTEDHQWILVAVFPLNRLSGARAGLAQEAES